MSQDDRDASWMKERQELTEAPTSSTERLPIMRNRFVRALATSVAAGMLASGAAVASTGTAIAVPAANAKVAVSPHAPAKPSPTPHHKKCPKGEHYTMVNGKWGCHKK
jgi:hypothetical protein